MRKQWPVRGIIQWSALVLLMGAVLAWPNGRVLAASCRVQNVSQGTCFLTIQSAIAKAGNADTLQIAPGTYSGGIVINKNVTLVGSPLDNSAVKILGNGPSGAPYGLIITASNVTINHLTISGFWGHAGAAGILVGGTAIGDTKHAANGVTITGNTFINDGNGVYLWQSSNDTVTHNDISHSRALGSQDGTGITSWAGTGDAQVTDANNRSQAGSNDQIAYNTIHDNDHLGIFVGACTQANYHCKGPSAVHADISGTSIESNVLTNNGLRGTAAIGVLDASNGTVTNNQVSNSANQGIVINYSDNIMVTSNRVNTANLWHQAFAGISILNSRAITVMGNITTNNGWGVQALNVSDSTFTNNSSFNNTRGDLYWDGKGSQSFDSNSCIHATPSTTDWQCG